MLYFRKHYTKLATAHSEMPQYLNFSSLLLAQQQVWGSAQAILPATNYTIHVTPRATISLKLLQAQCFIHLKTGLFIDTLSEQPKFLALNSSPWIFC